MKRVSLFMVVISWIWSLDAAHGFLLQGYYYPLLPQSEIQKLQGVFIDGSKHVLYRTCKNSTVNYILHSDQCPHQGASLSNGWVNSDGNLQCPYHGFEFLDGTAYRIPNSMNWSTKPVCFPRVHKTMIHEKTLYFMPQADNDDVFLSPHQSAFPYLPPEDSDPTFRKVQGYIDLDQDAQIVTENVLDMLHISYIHSFGNRVMPLPLSVSHKRLDDSSGRSTFFYYPNTNTISVQMGKIYRVKVENEYHLPTTTVTRVHAGTVEKTILTRSVPLSAHKTRLFYSVYRNFWIIPDFAVYNSLADLLITFLMQRTLLEDKWILDRVTSPLENKSPIITKYDVTIQEYRKSLERCLLRSTGGAADRHRRPL